MNNSVLKIGSKIASFGVFFIYFVLFLVGTMVWLVRSYWGDVDLLSVPVMLFNGLTNGVSKVLIFKVLFVLLAVPLGGIGVGLFLVKRFKKEYKREISLSIWGGYLFLLWGGGIWFCRQIIDREIIWHSFIAVCLIYFFIQRRDFRKGTLFFSAVLLFAGSFIFGWTKGVFDDLAVEECEFYLVEDTKKIKMNEKRNIILVFAESFEQRYSRIEEEAKVLKVNDEDAILFSDFMEGDALGATHSALSAALNGVKIYKKDVCLRHFMYDKVLENGNDFDNGLDVDRIGLGNVLAYNGYKNLFVKGADISFMNTDDILEKQGFLKENIHGQHSFLWWEEYKKNLKTDWWGPSDKDVFEFFKQKILEINGKEPFFAVMFTADLHPDTMEVLVNPYFDSKEEIIKGTINNLNEFIKWYKKQDFYENTSLVIIADHERKDSGSKAENKKLYNAFFNVPENLRLNLNLDRKFTQLDIAVTLLELAGAEIEERRYGVGVSVFSDNKTLAEK